MTRHYRTLQVASLLMIALATFACARFGDVAKGKVQNGTEVSLALKPAEPRMGGTDFKVSLQGPNGPIENAPVTVTYFMPAMGMMAEMKGSTPAKSSGGGEYVATLDLPMEGDWTVIVNASPANAQTITARFQIRTGSSTIRFLGQ